jgi:type VI secretion system secreted protein Hcp
MFDQSPSRRSLIAGGVAGTALGGLTLSSGSADAAVGIPSEPSAQFFLALTGIPGTSTDVQFPGTHEILDYGLGATTSVRPGSSGGAKGKAQPHDFTFTKVLDKSSPKLFLSCATGAHIKKATVTARKKSAKVEYLTFVLTDVFISSYHTAPGSGDALPLDVISLDYATLEIAYTPQTPDGSQGKPITAGFDFVTNKVL